MNILLITIDCLRQDRCGIYGHHRDTTPTLDALAREGFVFDNAYATGPVTTESFPGILAGRLSAQTVAGDNLYQKCIPKGEPTISSHLRDAGYNTVGVISNPRIGSHVDTDRGFEVFTNLRTRCDSDNEVNTDSILPDFRVGERLYQLRETMREYNSVPYRYELPFLAFRSYQYLAGWPSVRGERIINEFLDKLAGTSTPFFGWTHLMDVHGPLHPRSVIGGGLSDGGLLSQFRSHAKRVSNIYNAETEARYDSAVRYVDQQLERIVNWLQSNNIWDETALIITADHGEALHDRNLYGHPQHYMYDELLAVPLIVRTPDCKGGRIRRQFSLGYLHELICEITNTSSMDAPLHSNRGKHLSTVNDEVTASETIFADSISPKGHSIVARRSSEKCVVQLGSLAELEELEVQDSGTYWINRDPKERDLWKTADGELEQIARELSVNPEELPQRKERNIDPLAKDHLKQLGYVE